MAKLVKWSHWQIVCVWFVNSTRQPSSDHALQKYNKICSHSEISWYHTLLIICKVESLNKISRTVSGEIVCVVLRMGTINSNEIHIGILRIVIPSLTS